MSWEDRGACRLLVGRLVDEGVGWAEAHRRVWAMFYPVVPRGMTTWRMDPYRAARDVCATCPVAEQCLQEALDEEDFRGVRGGLDPRGLLAALGRSTTRIPA